MRGTWQTVGAAIFFIALGALITILMSVMWIVAVPLTAGVLYLFWRIQ